MTITARRLDDDDGQVWFVLDGIHDGSPVLGMVQKMLFQPFQEGWARRFSCEDLFVDEAYEGFSRRMPAMLERQSAGGVARWEDALGEVCGRAARADVAFFLVGSAGVALQGVAIEPGDLDLLIESDDDAKKLAAACVDLLVEPLARTPDWVGRWWARASVFDFRVEWVGGVDPATFGFTAHEPPVEVPWRGWSVGVQPLDRARSVNERLGRLDRVRAIERVLSGHERT